MRGILNNTLDSKQYAGFSGQISAPSMPCSLAGQTRFFPFLGGPKKKERIESDPRDYAMMVIIATIINHEKVNWT